MLKKFAKAIGYQASKIGWINREIQAYKIEQEKKVIEERIKRNKADFTDCFALSWPIMSGKGSFSPTNALAKSLDIIFSQNVVVRFKVL